MRALEAPYCLMQKNSQSFSNFINIKIFQLLTFWLITQ